MAVFTLKNTVYVSRHITQEPLARFGADAIFFLCYLPCLLSLCCALQMQPDLW